MMHYNTDSEKYSYYQLDNNSTCTAAASNKNMFLKEQEAIYSSCTNYYQRSHNLYVDINQIQKTVNLDCNLSAKKQSNQYLSEATPLMIGKSKIYTKSKKYNGIDEESNSLSGSENSSSTESTKKSSKKGDIWFSVYLMIYLLYLFMGSVAFERMEREPELTLRQEFRETRQRFLQKYNNIIGTHTQKQY